MARPKKHRSINCDPTSYYFKPAGVPIGHLDEVVLEDDELEAIRLGDLVNLSQEEAAEKMKISRATFGRIINSAHLKVADSIINGKAIKISVELSEEEKASFFSCGKCGLKLRMRHRKQFSTCPKCSN
jgi:predicted DNA-binding protein (UPF0251 family)